MIVVKVEVWPYGDETGAEEIASAYIGNMGSVEGSTHEHGNYHAVFHGKETKPGEQDAPPFYPHPARHPKLKGEGFVKQFPRIKKGVWELVAEALRAAGLDS